VALDTPENLKHSVGGDVISLEVASDKDLTEDLRRVPGVMDARKEDGQYRIKAVNGEELTPVVLKAVWDRGAVVTSVNLSHPTLDQAFLEYTGRSMRDAEQTGNFDRVAASRRARRMR